MGIFRNVSNQVFQYIHTHNLIYNTCWEDPRIDHEALQLTDEDNVLVITSAGCNTLDYALASPNHVYAVDMNPRQNAVLDLKMAGIRNLDYDCFFDLFGRGRMEDMGCIYDDKLRPALSPSSKAFWDKHLYYFSTQRPKNTYYFHGTSGLVARFVNKYLDFKPGLRQGVMDMFDADNIEKQRDLYFGFVRDLAWTPFIRKIICSDLTLYLAGVPKAQRDQIESNYERGVAELLEGCFDAVFAMLPLHDNYFWRVYVTGKYTKNCCPEYLKEDNFYRLKEGLVNRVSVFTDTVEGFLRKHDEPISKFVLLDHMDWLASHRQDWLQQEWQAIVDKAAPGATVLFRSGGLQVDYVDPLIVDLGAGKCSMGEILNYKHDLAASLHQRDRVHMYGSFYIANLALA